MLPSNAPYRLRKYFKSEDEPIWKEFVKFLYREKVYGIFMYNILNVDSRWMSTFSYREQNAQPYFYIVCAFEWIRTKEGMDFWQQVNIKWRKYMIELRDKKIWSLQKKD